MTSEHREVTVGLSCWNAAATLRMAIRSIFAQTHREWRLLVVDDGSTDGTMDIAASIKDSRVQVVRGDSKRGLAHRLNQITASSETFYLARMDADDLMTPNRLELQVRFMIQHPEIDVTSTACFSMDGSYRILGIRGIVGNRPSIQTLASGRMDIVHPTVMAKRSWVLANPYHEGYELAEDSELWYRTMSRVSFAGVEAPLLFYRESIPLHLQRYLVAKRSVDRAISRHGPAALGRLTTLRLRSTNAARSGIAAGLIAAGFSRRLIAARTRRVSPSELRSARRMLQQIDATAVPGW